MTRTALLALAEKLLTLPTAPYHEEHIRQFISGYCAEIGLQLDTDSVGNMIVTLPGTAANAQLTPLVFVAHMDHPGFEILDSKRAQFLGGVPTEMFVGNRFKVFTTDGIRLAEITRVLDKKTKVLAIRPVKKGLASWQKGDFGMWHLPPFRVSGDRLQATSIDDVLSVAATLAMMTELKRRRAKAPVWAVFTRAEEVGFQGAIALARANGIPKTASVISMEMSKARPWAQIGNGPVIRVGDRVSSFDPRLLYFLESVANEHQKAHPDTFRFQKALMDGGACEATAFAAYGYRTAGLCLPLGNYHNIGPGPKPRAEYVSVSDFEHLVTLMVAAAINWRQADKIQGTLAKRVDAIRRAAPRKF